MSKDNTNDTTEVTLPSLDGLSGHMTLSTQALSCVMLSLQKCLLEQSDITEILKDLRFNVTKDTNELVVLNPPPITFPDSGGSD